MAITSENKPKWGIQLRSSQFRYAVTYIVVTFLVLFFLNIYSSEITQTLFFTGKETAMIEKCQIVANEIGKLEVMNKTTVSSAVSQLNRVNVSRLLVTDSAGVTIFDSSSTAKDSGQFILFAEVVQALKGNNVFSGNYHNGIIQSRAATPVYSYGTLIGCVYMMEFDAQQGALIQSLQKNTLTISIILELAVIIFSLIYSHSFSNRLKKITASMRTIREGDYSQGVKIGGNDELTILGNEFNDLVSRLQTSEQKRNNFVSDASHELKTPLASIKLLSDSNLQNDMDIATIREFVGDIGNEADRLNRMSEKLLSLSRIESQKDSDCEIVYMTPTIQRVIHMLTIHAERNNITFETDFANDCPILVLEDDLYQIIFNLVENAIKYNVTGGKVFLSLHREGDNALLRIRDTGVGIPEDAIGHIFERFYRVDKARSRKTGGSGLGLSIVRNIVERNQGTIGVESTVGEGTTFTLAFPAFDTEETL